MRGLAPPRFDQRAIATARPKTIATAIDIHVSATVTNVPDASAGKCPAISRISKTMTLSLHAPFESGHDQTRGKAQGKVEQRH